MTVKSQFEAFVAATRIDELTQRDVLLSWIEDNAAARFPVFLDTLCAELAKPVPTESKRPPSPGGDRSEHVSTTPQQMAELNATIDRSFAVRALEQLTQLTDAKISTRKLDMSAQLTLPAAQWEVAQAFLDGAVGTEDRQPNDILIGWHYRFGDGDIVAIIVTRSNSAQSAFIDATMILPAMSSEKLPIISLPPVYTLDEGFIFKYAGGLTKTVQIVPPAVTAS